MNVCKERFYQTWKHVDAIGKTRDIWEKIESQYGQPHRQYHALAHIHHCLNQLELVWLEPSNAYLISWALFFHDYFYDSSDWNEEKSGIESMRVAFRAGLSVEFATASRLLIRATKKHQIIETPYVARKDMEILLDIDLSILGKPWEQYDLLYRQPIRKEYESIAWPIFSEKRSEILEIFLKRDRLYFHPFFFGRYEAQARENLAREINILQTMKEEDAYAG